MAEKICNKCGSRLHSSVNYCPYCKSSSFRSLNEIQLHDDSLKYKLFYWKQGSYYVLSKTKVAALVTFVFFAGIIAGHFGLKINQDMLTMLQNFGLILFIYALGVQVGPGFFSAFKKGGIKLNGLSLLLALMGTLFTVGFHWLSGIPMPEMMGLFSGAATNTPMLGAAQQAFLQLHPENIDSANNMAIACAVGYPFGLIGVLLCVIILKKTTK